MRILASRFDRQLYDVVRRTTQPSLAQEAKEAILNAGQALGDKIQETATEVKQNIQSL